MINYPALSALELHDLLVGGGTTASAVADQLLAIIAEKEAATRAWVWQDPAFVRAQAAELDARLGGGTTHGPLHGLPVGVKDIIDTSGIPTQNGTVLDAGRIPDRNATVVDRMKAAGGVLMGKTVTTELAFFEPRETRNPHNIAHTPGGSSSGSAAAVAAGMVPLAIGTQTAGSVIRPAAFCGIVGFKPSYCSIPREGVLDQSSFLDTVGVFARTVADAALLAGVLADTDWGEAIRERPVSPPKFAFVRQPAWDRADDTLKSAMIALVDALGDACEDIRLPAPFDHAVELRMTINHYEMAIAFQRYMAAGADKLGAKTRSAIEAGRVIPESDYAAARRSREILNTELESIWKDYDAILTPAALGAAPLGLESTGDPVYCATWSLCGTPAITLPVMRASNGLPMGLQVVGARGADAKLLQVARWLEDRLIFSE